MRLHPVGEALDEGRTVSVATALEGRGDGGEHGGDIIAVDAQARHSVAGGAIGEHRRVRLLPQGSGDRVLVVLQHEDRRGLPHGGEVEGLVGVAFAAGAIAEEGESRGILALELRGHRESGGVQSLCRKRRRRR